jgi:uncharacterized protein (DUF58 family)
MTHGRVLAGIAVVVATVALATGNSSLTRLTYVLVGVLFVSATLSLLSLRWVDLTRTTRSRRASVGGLAEETFTLENRGWLPKLWIEVDDDSDLPGHRASRVVSSLGPGERRTWAVRTACTRRGAFTLGPVTLAGGDPLGMFRREVHLERTAGIVVYPITVPLSGLQLPTGFVSGGPVVRRRAEFATANVRGVRQYAPGDAFNRVHWPTTAKRGKLFVKEFELDPMADIWVTLDLDRSVHVGESADHDPDPLDTLAWTEPPHYELPPTTEEYAVSAAASVARHFLGQGKSVGLLAHGQRRVVLRPDRGERQLHKILGHLAVLRARGHTGFAELLSLEGHEFTRHATLIAITPATTLQWVDALRQLRMRGVASLAIVIEASTFGTAAAPSLATASSLAANGIPSRLVKCGGDMAAALTT